MKFPLGTEPDGAALSCDLKRLTDTRLLVQANSGGGKSWCLRRLLEQTHGHVQHLVIDPEGEFSTLRERFDYVVAAARDGDTVAHPRSAALLAERLLELGVSAILDLYELKAHDRVRFVRLFLEALVDAPKRLWHPALVVVDEAHVYCPEKGDAESAGAVIDLATRGRKRGFCAIFATQRLSKLRKDAAAECNNKLIGRTALDVDMKRAADELGFTGRDEQHALRRLPEGHFFAFGPAIAAAVTRVHVGPIVTSHPKAGGRLAFTPPPPTAKVKALLPQLADLPAEAEQRAAAVEDLRRELAATKRALAAAERAQPAPTVERVEVPVVSAANVKALERAAGRFEAAAERVTSFSATLQEMGRLAREEAAALRGMLAAATSPRAAGPPPAARPPVATPHRAAAAATTARVAVSTNGDLRPMIRAMLTALAQHPDGLTKAQIRLHAGYADSGPVSSAFAEVLTTGWVTAGGGRLLITSRGLEALGPYDPLPIGAALREHLLTGDKLSKMQRSLLDAACQAYPAEAGKGALREAAGYADSGPVSSAFARLVRYGYLEAVGQSRVRASPVLFD